MQHKAVYLLFCKFTLHVSGVNHTPSSGVHKTVTTASGTGHIFCASYLPPTWPSSPSKVAKLARPRWRQVAAHPTSGVHKTATTASGTGHIFCASYLPPTWPSSPSKVAKLSLQSGQAS